MQRPPVWKLIFLVRVSAGAPRNLALGRTWLASSHRRLKFAKSLVCVCAAHFTTGLEPSFARTRHLTLGPHGTLAPFVGFNETRGIDVTVLADENPRLTSMKLDALSLGSATRFSRATDRTSRSPRRRG